MPSMASSTLSRNFLSSTDKSRSLSPFPSFFPAPKSPAALNPFFFRHLKCYSKFQPSSMAAAKNPRLRANPLLFRPPAADLFSLPKINGPITAFFFTVSLFASSPSSSPGAATPEVAFVKQTVASLDIVIFSKSYCPYCKRAKAVFKELNKVPHVIELDQRVDGMKIQDALGEIVGRRTVPQVFIKGKHIGGSDDTVKAYDSGKLSQLLSNAPEEKL
ncbi:hypothetical protein ACLOJK_030740 [Asimina triloba]